MVAISAELYLVLRDLVFLKAFSKVQIRRSNRIVVLRVENKQNK